MDKYAFGFDVTIRRAHGASEVEFRSAPQGLTGPQLVTALALGLALICQRDRLDPEILWESMRAALVDSCKELQAAGAGIEPA